MVYKTNQLLFQLIRTFVLISWGLVGHGVYNWLLLGDEWSCRVLINRIEVLLDSLDHDLELLLVLSSYQKVLAQVLVASAVGMALIEAEYFVDGGLGAHLECYHFAGLRAQLFVVGGVLQFPVRLVAGTLLGVLTTV